MSTGVLVGGLVAGALLLQSIHPLEHDGLPTGTFFGYVAAGVAIVALLALIGPGASRLTPSVAIVPFVVGMVVSLAFYLCPPGIDGRGDFQLRVAISAVVLTAWVAARPAHDSRGRFRMGLFAALGIFALPALLVALYAISCPDGGCLS
jgi:hypothetical protein